MTLAELWDAYVAERSISLCPTSLVSDYRLAFQSYFRKKMAPLHQAGLISHLYRPYDCRHTAISRWIEAGIPVPQVAAWAGNTSEVIFKHYCNTTQEYEMPVL